MIGLKQFLEFQAGLKNVPWDKVEKAVLQKCIDEPVRFAAEFLKFLQNFSKVDLPDQKEDPILRRLFEGESISIGARDGSRYISKEKGVFRVFIDSCFKSWGLDKCGKATEKTEVSVYEMVKDAKFAPMFSSLNLDLDKLCFSQDQIIEFCEEHCSRLRTDGYATFFLFKQDDQFFVARVDVNSDGLSVDVSRLENDNVWFSSCAHRLVVPQLTV